MVVILNTTINEPSCNSSNNYLEKEQVLTGQICDFRKKKIVWYFQMFDLKATDLFLMWANIFNRRGNLL